MGNSDEVEKVTEMVKRACEKAARWGFDTTDILAEFEGDRSVYAGFIAMNKVIGLYIGGVEGCSSSGTGQ